MTSPLYNLPSNELRCIFEKMRPLSLNRFRQTNKRIYSFLENNRHQLKCSADHDRLIFEICINDYEEKAISYKIGQHYTEVVLIKDMPLVEIEDPYKQLSNLRFNLFKMGFGYLPGEGFDQRVQRMLKVNSEIVQPLIHKLRIHCIEFFLSALKIPFEKHFTELISKINFSKILVISPFDFNVLQNPFIQNCTYACFDAIPTVPDDISTILSRCPISEVIFETFSQQCFNTQLMLFLQKVRENSKVKGGVRKCEFNLIGDFFDILMETEGVVHILSRELMTAYPVLYGTRKTVKHFFQMKLNDGGMAIILLFERFCEVTFVSDVKRETLFDTMAPQIFFKTPYDVSSCFNDFLSAENVREAYENLLEAFML